MNSDSESKVSAITLHRLEFDLHSIIRNFPACVSHFPVLGTVFIEDRIRIVDVKQDAPPTLRRPKFLEQAAGTGKRNMPDFARRFRANACGNQFVVTPERSVEQTNVA